MTQLLSYAPAAARFLLGAIFVVFGLNGFFHFLPMPPLEGDAATFMGGLAAAGYFFPLLKGTEVAVGLALLTGRFVPLALVVLAPITVNIVAFHTLAPQGLPLALLVVGLQGGLAWHHRAAFAPLLRAKHSSAARATSPEGDPALAATGAA